MDKETSQIIKNIAEIQIEALKRIIDKEDEPNASLSQELLIELLNIDISQLLESGTPYNKMNQKLKSLIHHKVYMRIDAYKQLIDIPSAICCLDEYQLLLCSHILWKMEEVWILDNPQGVNGAWLEINKALYKFHPEYTLIIN